MAGSKEDTWRVLRESRGGGYPGGRGYLGGGPVPQREGSRGAPPGPHSRCCHARFGPGGGSAPPAPHPAPHGGSTRGRRCRQLPFRGFPAALCSPARWGPRLCAPPPEPPLPHTPAPRTVLQRWVRARPPRHSATPPPLLWGSQGKPGAPPPPPSPRAMTVTLFFHCARGAPGGAQSRTPPPFPDPNPTPEGEGRGGGWGAAPPIRTAEGDSGGANNSAERSPRSAPPPPHFPPQHRDTAPRGAPPGPTGVICGAAPARQRHAATPPPPPPRCTPHSPVGTPPPGPARPQLSRLRRPLKVTRESCAAGTARGGGCGLRAGGEMGGVGTPHRPAWVSAEPCGTRGRCSAAAAMGMRGRG